MLLSVVGVCRYLSIGGPIMLMYYHQLIEAGYDMLSLAYTVPLVGDLCNPSLQLGRRSLALLGSSHLVVLVCIHPKIIYSMSSGSSWYCVKRIAFPTRLF